MRKLWLILAFSVSLAACSSKKPVAEDGMGEAAAAESASDEVGSVPEDMLGNEVGGENASEEPAASGDSDDPFADLKSDGGNSEEPAASSTKVEEETVQEKASAADATTTYTVRAGDTLMKIAFKLYGDLDRWKEIHEWNKAKLANANKLEKGMVLSVEPETNGHAPNLPHSYKIKRGDTLAGIASDVYGKASKWRKLQKFNSKLIKDPNKIFAGFTLWYDITPKELAEAEQRRAGKMAETSPAAPSSPAVERSGAAFRQEQPPSAINPPVESAPMVSGQPNVAVAPSEAPVIDGAPAQPTAPRQ